MENINNEAEVIVEILNYNLEEGMEAYPEFHVGEYVELPNHCGCFKRESKWYSYTIDERKFATFTGPFDNSGIIYACAKLLHEAKRFKEYKFSEKELEIYLNNNFHTFAEIDNYIKQN